MNNLKELISQAKELNLKVKNEGFDFVQRNKQKLMSLVARHPAPDELGFERDLYLDFVMPGTSIRYCGRFHNTIVLLYDKPSEDPINIKLMQIFDESENKENYTTFIEDSDFRNFRLLANALEIYFKDTELKKEYADFLDEINKEQAFDCPMATLESDFSQHLDDVFSDIFEKKFPGHAAYNQNKDLCILLPDGLNLLVYGKYYNAIVLDDFGYSLAYLQRTSYEGEPEEEYFVDEYTSFRDSVRHHSNSYKTIHSLVIDFQRGNLDQMIDALKVIDHLLSQEEYGRELKTTILRYEK